MSSIILSIIASLFLVFLDTVLTVAGLISVSVILVLVLHDRMKTLNFVVFVAIYSVIIDSYFGFLIGTHFVVLILVVMIFLFFKAVLPFERVLVRGVITLVSFLSFHVLIHVAITLQIGGVPDLEIVTVLTGSFLRSIIESLLFFALAFVSTNYLGSNSSAVKVKI